MSLIDVIRTNYECFVVESSVDACVVGSRRVTFWNLIFFKFQLWIKLLFVNECCTSTYWIILSVWGDVCLMYDEYCVDERWKNIDDDRLNVLTCWQVKPLCSMMLYSLIELVFEWERPAVFRPQILCRIHSNFTH